MNNKSTSHKNKKGQFGPDAIVGPVLLAILSLGGVYFLNTFVAGVTFEGVISILDQEIDQRCFFMILPMVRDDYLRGGHDVSEHEAFGKFENYFGGERRYTEISQNYEASLIELSQKMKLNIFTQDDYTQYYGFLATTPIANELMMENYRKIEEANLSMTMFCFTPVYSPGGISGRAELMIATEEKTPEDLETHR